MVCRLGPDQTAIRPGFGSRHTGARGQGGQFLVISGIFLTLGLMVFASTVVTLEGWEERAHRESRHTLVDSVDELVATLEQTLSNLHRPGQMNKTVFQEAAAVTQKELENNAVRSGLFATIRLDGDPDLSMVQTADRCLGLDVDASVAGGGVIYGWDVETLQRGIVGAVYELHVTDGKKSLRTEHYVGLQECASDEVTTFAHRWSSQIGILENFTASHVKKGEMNITEELDWDNLVEIHVHPVINQSTIEVHGWNKQDNLLALNGLYTEMPSRASSLPENNWFRFRVEPPERLREGDALPNVTLEVTGYKNVVDDQTMYLRVYKNDTWEHPALEEIVDLPTNTPDTLEIVLDELDPGQGGWTLENMTQTWWELSVNGDHNSNQAWHMDHFNMTGSLLTAQAYRANLTFEWPEIPGLYTDHELELSYRFDENTEGEGFRLEVRDRDQVIAGGQWMLVVNMTDSSHLPDGWSHGTYQTAEGPDGPELLPNRPEFRIVDSHHYDNWVPEDEDRLEVGLLRLVSRLP